jgi:hypothetical protein
MHKNIQVVRIKEKYADYRKISMHNGIANGMRENRSIGQWTVQFVIYTRG